MSIELNENFNQIVKKVEFFPFEWNVNLLAVIFSDSINFFNLVEDRKEVTYSTCSFLNFIFIIQPFRIQTSEMKPHPLQATNYSY